jgi:hypothetical protein
MADDIKADGWDYCFSNRYLLESHRSKRRKRGIECQRNAWLLLCPRLLESVWLLPLRHTQPARLRRRSGQPAAAMLSGFAHLPCLILSSSPLVCRATKARSARAAVRRWVVVARKRKLVDHQNEAPAGLICRRVLGLTLLCRACLSPRGIALWNERHAVRETVGMAVGRKCSVCLVRQFHWRDL